MGRFGKNDWKVKAFYVLGGIVVLLIIAALVFTLPKVISVQEQNSRTAASRGTAAVSNTIDSTTIPTAEPVITTESTTESTAEPITEPTRGDTEAYLLSSGPSMANHIEIPVIAASATSTISQKDTNNHPMCMFDKRDDTSWQEGVNGYGINESVSFSFDRQWNVKYIAFKLGNWKNDKYYYGNAKPKTMTLTFGDYSGQVTFTGARAIEWVEVNYPVTADSMRITINDVYPGTSWEDTCITEITVYGQ